LPRQVRIARHQAVAELHGLLVLAQVFDQQLRAIQVRGDELRVRLERAFELVERLIDATLVPEDFAAAVVRLGPVGVCPQSLF
jgi:hypothetical protein